MGQGRHKEENITRRQAEVMQEICRFFSIYRKMPTMQQVADEMRLNTSTVSRAVKDKYIQFQTRLIPLRSLFSSSLQGDDGSLVSADAVKQQLRLFIRAEDPGAPLSDEALTAALASVGVHISRRTVAKYRAELNIPTAAARKRDSRNRT